MTQKALTAEQVARWLDESGLEYTQCGECDALHLQALNDLEGLVEARLFVEPWGLLLSNEFELRPTALLPLAADLGRLNYGYATLKIFSDVVDDAMPQLIASAAVLAYADFNRDHLKHFLEDSFAVLRQFGDECRQLQYLYIEGADQGSGRNKSNLH